MIQSFLIAVLLVPVIPLLHKVGMHKFGTHRAIFAMFLTLTIYNALWFIGYVFLKAFEIRSFLGGLGIAGFISLSYVEFFSMLCRGFSLTILVDLEEKPAQSEEEIIANYGGGMSAEWGFTKRLGSLKKMGWIDWNEKSLWLTTKTAYLVGHLGVLYKRTLRLSGGG